MINYSHLSPSYPNLLFSAVVYFVSQEVNSMGGVISLWNLWLLTSGSGSSSRRLEARKKEFKVLLWPSSFFMSFMSMLQAQQGYRSGPTTSFHCAFISWGGHGSLLLVDPGVSVSFITSPNCLTCLPLLYMVWALNSL